MPANQTDPPAPPRPAGWMGDREELTAIIWRAMQDASYADAIRIEEADAHARHFLAQQASAPAPQPVGEKHVTNEHDDCVRWCPACVARRKQASAPAPGADGAAPQSGEVERARSGTRSEAEQYGAQQALLWVLREPNTAAPSALPLASELTEAPHAE